MYYRTDTIYNIHCTIVSLYADNNTITMLGMVCILRIISINSPLYEHLFYIIIIHRMHCKKINLIPLTMYATLSGHFLPNPNGGEILLRSLMTSSCLIRPVAFGSKSAHFRTNLLRWWSPTMDMSRVR